MKSTNIFRLTVNLARTRVESVVTHGSVTMIVHGAFHDELPRLVSDGTKDDSNKSQNLFDLVICVGSSHVVGNFADTVRVAAGSIGSEGRILLGELYWRRTPPQA